jgi:zinc transporter
MRTETPTHAIDPTYGSDQHGLVWAYQFTPGQPGRPITSESVVELLALLDHSTPDQFLWLHFSLANSACEHWLRENLSLPDAFYQSLHADAGATWLEQVSNTLVAVIHDVLFDFKFDASEVATTSLCVDRHLLVRARLRPLRSIDRLRPAVRNGHAFQSPADLLAHLLRDQSDVLVEILRQSTQRADQIEDKLLAYRPRSKSQRIRLPATGAGSTATAAGPRARHAVSPS